MYVDAFLQRKSDTIHVAERVNGQRVLRKARAEHVLYYANQTGTHTSLYGDTCKRYRTNSGREFVAELNKLKASGKKIFESDIDPVFRHLAAQYGDGATPTLNVGFFDIEAAFHPTRGYAPTDDPFNAITAITLYESQTETLTTLALCPATYTAEQGRAIAAKFDHTTLFTDEAALLLAFLDLIEPVDVLSGWNSTQYDIPYLINRVALLLDRATTRRFCLWDVLPRPVEKKSAFGTHFNTYALTGRVHLDYMDLYKKHNTQQQHSYRLDFIGEIEVGENKVPYEGTLDDLYNKDFERFIGYSRQDVALLVKIDAKRKFIELANQIAHANCVLLPTTMGTVSLVETAIINAMHDMGFVALDRKPREQDQFDQDGNAIEEEERTPVVGAYVAEPRKGIHEWIGCVDIRSLYPSAIRALNMSPETIFAQIRPEATDRLIAERIASGTPRAEAWEGLFSLIEVTQMHDRTEDSVTLDFEDGSERVMTAAALHDYIFDPANSVCISANGTVFRTDKEGIIPKLLGDWYAQRKSLQKSMRDWKAKAEQAENDADKKDALKWVTFYDQRQLAAKIRLNALYGALLQQSCKFFDERLGQSTTLSGRSIVRHMASAINEIVTGSYDHVGVTSYYNDTDSAYFSAYAALKDHPDYAGFDWSAENIIDFYDAIAEQANETFAAFMHQNFNTGLQRGGIIQAGRELVASKVLFIKKKKYACLMIDMEGERLDVKGKPGKLKAMGLDLKRADTPKYMQQFLEKMLMDLLTGRDKAAIYRDIMDFRQAFKTRPAWEKGSPKKVSNLSGPVDDLKAAEQVGLTGRIKQNQKLKVTMPGHARASIHWNTLCDINNDRHVARITDGTRIIVCKLRGNAMGMDSVAYPIDEPHLPGWFRDLPFDDAAMEQAIVDQKILNLVGVLAWDLTDTKPAAGAEFFSFG